MKRADLRGRGALHLKKQPKSKVRPDGSRESKHWKPSGLHGERLALKMRRIVRIATRELEVFLRPHEGRILAAQVIAQYKETQSVAMLRDAGVQLLGDEVKEK